MPSRSDEIKLPEVMVFAGPNGSGKSTISRYLTHINKFNKSIKQKKGDHSDEKNEK